MRYNSWKCAAPEGLESSFKGGAMRTQSKTAEVTQ